MAAESVKPQSHRPRSLFSTPLLPPVRAAFVERVEDYVATFGVVEAPRELQCRVVNDRGIAPASNLPARLEDDRRLPGSGVRNDLDMLRLGLGRDAKQLLHAVRFDADSIALHLLVELLRSQPLRASHPAPILHFLASFDVAGDGKRELQDEPREARSRP